MNLRELAEEIHETAREKGWWDTDKGTVQDKAVRLLMLHSEVAEATECVRNENAELEEVIDVVIRALDYIQGYYGGDALEIALRTKMDTNKGRPYRHGGKLL